MTERSIYFFLTGIVSLLLTSCHVSQKLGNQPLALYQPDFSIPAMLDQEGELTNLLLRLPPGNYDVAVEVFESFRGKSPIFDFQEEFKIPEREELVRIPLPIRKSIFPVTVKVQDLDNDRLFEDILIPQNSLSANRQHLQLTLDGKPFFDRYVTKGTTLQLEYDNLEITSVFVQYSDKKYTPAPPPANAGYSFVPVKLDGLPTKHSIEEPLVFDKEGLYYIKLTENAKAGIFLRCVDSEFPKLTNINELILSIRYITKNEEYEGLTNSPNKKEALDAFWLDRSSGKERARQLIKKYYSRIQEANTWFTSYKAGWKTDRGLIYTIFGTPTRIEKTPANEYWYYDQNSARPNVSFFL